jgi:hypothetical protein
VSLLATQGPVNGKRAAVAGTHEVTNAWYLGAIYESGHLKLQGAMHDYRLAPAAAEFNAQARLYWDSINDLVAPSLL